MWPVSVSVIYVTLGLVSGPMLAKTEVVVILSKQNKNSSDIWMKKQQFLSCRLRLCHWRLYWFKVHLNTLSLRQNGCNFPDDIFKCIFFNKDCFILLKILFTFVPLGQLTMSIGLDDGLAPVRQQDIILHHSASMSSSLFTVCTKS